MNRLIVLVGATAVGKSEAALQLARRFGCEIISGDSMCVYRGMDIGTAKPTANERRQIPHHLIDVLEPEENFSVVDFQRLAAEAVDAVNKRGRIPLLVGGTGLYVQAFLEGYQFNRTPKTQLREDLQATTDDAGEYGLYQKLREQDPQTASRLHPNDRRRILRALEVVANEQQPMSQNKKTGDPSLLYDGLIFGLTRERPELYRRIDMRVDAMFAAGLVDEVNRLLSEGLPADCTAMQAIGYKEIVSHLRNGMDLDLTVERIKQASRRFAKRQLTWFRRMPYIRWIGMNESQDVEEAVADMSRQVAEKFSIR